jgi:hypothetical protein
MEYNSVKSLNQVKTRRASNKPSLDRRAPISPVLLSRAARIQRIRERHHVSLNILTLFDFDRFSSAMQASIRRIIGITPTGGCVYGMIHGRMGLAVPVTYYFENSRRSLWRLEILLEYHQSYLSKDAE